MEIIGKLKSALFLQLPTIEETEPYRKMFFEKCIEVDKFSHGSITALKNMQ